MDSGVDLHPAWHPGQTLTIWHVKTASMAISDVDIDLLPKPCYLCGEPIRRGTES